MIGSAIRDLFASLVSTSSGSGRPAEGDASAFSGLLNHLSSAEAATGADGAPLPESGSEAVTVEGQTILAGEPATEAETETEPGDTTPSEVEGAESARSLSLAFDALRAGQSAAGSETTDAESAAADDSPEQTASVPAKTEKGETPVQAAPPGVSPDAVPTALSTAPTAAPPEALPEANAPAAGPRASETPAAQLAAQAADAPENTTHNPLSPASATARTSTEPALSGPDLDTSSQQIAAPPGQEKAQNPPAAAPTAPAPSGAPLSAATEMGTRDRPPSESLPASEAISDQTPGAPRAGNAARSEVGTAASAVGATATGSAAPDLQAGPDQAGQRPAEPRDAPPVIHARTGHATEPVRSVPADSAATPSASGQRGSESADHPISDGRPVSNVEGKLPTIPSGRQPAEGTPVGQVARTETTFPATAARGGPGDAGQTLSGAREPGLESTGSLTGSPTTAVASTGGAKAGADEAPGPQTITPAPADVAEGTRSSGEPTSTPASGTRSAPALAGEQVAASVPGAPGASSAIKEAPPAGASAQSPVESSTPPGRVAEAAATAESRAPTVPQAPSKPVHEAASSAPQPSSFARMDAEVSQPGTLIDPIISSPARPAGIEHSEPAGPASEAAPIAARPVLDARPARAESANLPRVGATIAETASAGQAASEATSAPDVQTTLPTADAAAKEVPHAGLSLNTAPNRPDSATNSASATEPRFAAGAQSMSSTPASPTAAAAGQASETTAALAQAPANETATASLQTGVDRTPEPVPASAPRPEARPAATTPLSPSASTTDSGFVGRDPALQGAVVRETRGLSVTASTVSERTAPTADTTPAGVSAASEGRTAASAAASASAASARSTGAERPLPQAPIPAPADARPAQASPNASTAEGQTTTAGSQHAGHQGGSQGGQRDAQSDRQPSSNPAAAAAARSAAASGQPDGVAAQTQAPAAPTPEPMFDANALEPTDAAILDFIDDYMRAGAEARDAGPTRPLHAPTASRALLTAAWLRATRADGPPTAQPGGWKEVRMQLDDDQGDMRISARRTDERVAVHIQVSDPKVQAQLIQSMDRLQETLRERYDAEVDLSFGQDSSNEQEAREHRFGDRRDRLSSSSPSSASPRPTAARPRPTDGASNVWIG